MRLNPCKVSLNIKTNIKNEHPSQGLEPDGGGGRLGSGSHSGGVGDREAGGRVVGNQNEHPSFGSIGQMGDWRVGARVGGLKAWEAGGWGGGPSLLSGIPFPLSGIPDPLSGISSH